jgi:hypothetical protein
MGTATDYGQMRHVKGVDAHEFADGKGTIPAMLNLTVEFRSEWLCGGNMGPEGCVAIGQKNAKETEFSMSSIPVDRFNLENKRRGEKNKNVTVNMLVAVGYTVLLAVLLVGGK